MAKKKELKNPMEDYINLLIDKKLENWQTKLTTDDAQIIVDGIMPELEALVAREVLKHLKILLNHSIKKLKEE